MIDTQCDVEENGVKSELTNAVLFDINLLHNPPNQPLQLSRNTNSYHNCLSNKQSPKQQQIEITPEDQFLIKNNVYSVDAPVFKFIMHNPKAEFIPRELLYDYVGSFNISNQTPLMLSAAISNITFVRQLLPVDIGVLDDFGKSALDYAKEFSASAEVVELLSEYETM